MLASRKHALRLLPDQRGPFAKAVQMPDEPPPADVAWLEPFPDSDLEGIADEAPNPEARYSLREAVQLAFVAAIQELPPRQRAALLLSDVLGWSAVETANLLGGTAASINSALQRARETLAKRYPAGRPLTFPRPSPAQQDLLSRYLTAWEGHDLNGFVALLQEDATFTMPPWPQWYAGRDAIRSFFELAWKTCGGLRMVPIAANGQPGFAVYERSSESGFWAAHSLHVLALHENGISTMTLFVPPTGPQLFDAFKLPGTLRASGFCKIVDLLLNPGIQRSRRNAETVHHFLQR
jgi:RNA polymerase sigma-70 factor (ECF subfamily)